jgi:hypothetical protein
MTNTLNSHQLVTTSQSTALSILLAQPGPKNKSAVIRSYICIGQRCGHGGIWAGYLPFELGAALTEAKPVGIFPSVCLTEKEIGSKEVNWLDTQAPKFPISAKACFLQPYPGAGRMLTVQDKITSCFPTEVFDDHKKKKKSTTNSQRIRH